MAATAKKKTATKSKTKPTSAKKAKSAAKNVKAVSVKVDKGSTQDRLKKFNIFAGVSSLAFAILSVIFMSKETIVTSLPYAAKDEFASTATVVFGPAYKTLCEVEIRYIMAFIFGLSAIFSLLLATRLRNKYNSQLANSTSVIRWIFTGISLGLILELVTAIAEVDNIVALKITGALVVVTSILWIISEQYNKTSKGNLSFYYLSLFTLFLAVMPLLVSLVASGIYGMEWFGWHVYLVSAATVGGFAAFVFNQFKFAKNGVSAKGYLELEGKYLSIDYLIKFSVFIIFLAAFLK